MNNLQLTQIPFAKAEMLIRKPVADVFEAFINPSITSKFWFSRGSGRLKQDKEIQWDWEMYHVSTRVSVKAIEENKRILIECDGYSARTKVVGLYSSQREYDVREHHRERFHREWR